MRHIIPETLEEALHVIAQGPTIKLAGGTDIMVKHRASQGLAAKLRQDVVYLLNVPDLHYIRKEDNGLRIGGMVPIETLLHHDDVPKILRDTLLDFASPGLRYVATLAGNIANASPAGDALVTLYALDALVRLKSLERTRDVPIEAVIVGPSQTTIQDDELIESVFLPDASFTHTEWRKVGTRRADAISKVAFTGCVTLDNDIVQDIRLAFGAVFKTVYRNRSLEKALIGQHRHDVVKQSDALCEKYLENIAPIDDQRSNASYRNTVTKNLLKAFIEKLS